MAIDNEPVFTSARLFSVLRLKPFRALSRSWFLIALGAVTSLWLIIAQFGSFPFRSGPPFPPPSRPPPGFRPPPFDGSQVGSEEWAARADKVKEAFLHAYHGYEKFASPSDELLPISNGSINK